MKLKPSSCNLINRLPGQFRIKLPVTISLFIGVVASTAQAQVSLTWTGGGTNAFWAQANNWGGIAPTFGNTTDITMAGTVRPDNQLSGDRTVRSITYTNTAAFLNRTRASAATTAAGRNLTFSADSGNATITVDSAAAAASILAGGVTGSGSGGGIVIASDLDVIHNGANLLTLGDANCAISGPGAITKTGTGTLVFGGSHSYAGNTVISDGTLNLKAGTAIPDGVGKGNLIVNNPGIVEINGQAETINGLVGNGIVDNTSGTDATLTVGGDSVSSTFDGVLQNTGSPLNLAKTGGGNFSLKGISTYSGNTTIADGKLTGVVGGSAANSPVTIDSSTATYAVSVTDNTKKWTAPSLATSASGAVEFAFGAVAPSVSVAPLEITGDVDFSSATPIFKVTGSSLAVGTYPLMTWGGTRSGTIPTAVSLPEGVDGDLVVSGSTLNLVIDSVFVPLLKANNETNLNVSSSWTTGVPGASDVAPWNNLVTGANTTNLGADLTWAGIKILDPGGEITINTGNTLTLGAAASDIDMADATVNLTLNCGLAVGADSVWNIGTGGELILGGAVSGAFPITKTGSGKATLAGANTFSAGITLVTGTLHLNNPDALGAAASTFTIEGGTIDNSSGGEVTLSANNPMNWNGDFSYGGTDALNLGTGAVTPNGDRTITTLGNTLSVGGIIGGGTVSITKAGVGGLILSGNNTFDGVLAVNAGTLTLSGTNSVTETRVNATGTLNINADNSIGTGPLILEGQSTFANTSGAPLVLITNNSQAWNGLVTFAGPDSLDLGAGAVSLGFNPTMSVTSSTLTAGGVISGTNVDLAKIGNGILSLTGVNDFSGNTVRMSGGSLRINSIANAGLPCALGAGSVIQIGIVSSTGTLEYKAVAAGSTDRQVRVGDSGNGSAGANITNNSDDAAHTLTFTNPNFNLGNSNASSTPGRTLTLSGTNTGDNEIQGVIIDHTNGSFPQIKLTKNGTGTWVLSGANTYSGETLIGNGALKLGASGVIPDGPGKGNLAVNALLDMNGRNETVNGLSGNGNGEIDNTAAAPCVLTAGNNDQDSTFAGDIQNPTGGAVSLVKMGVGRLNLTGTNTNTGETFVKAGTLALNGTSIADTARLQLKNSAVVELVADETVDTLYIDGVPMAAGTYGSSSVAVPPVGMVMDDVHFSVTGTGILTVNNIGPVLATPFEDWISGFYPDEPEASDPNFVGPDADPDNDGQSNIVEFALGGAPDSGSNNAKVYSLLADGSADVDTTPELLMTVAVRSGTPFFSGSPSPGATHEGFVYTAQGSTMLDGFTTGVTPVSPVTDGLPAVPAGYEYRTFSLNGSNGPTGMGFLRMEISAEP